MNLGLYDVQDKLIIGQFCFQNNFERRQNDYTRRIPMKNLIINKTGHWTEKQNAKYYAFLQKFKDKFSQKLSRRQWKVFKSLAQFVKTRNANQCRSHHHKMQKNFQTIQQTLEYLKSKRPGLEKKCEKYAQQLNKIQSQIFSLGSIQFSEKQKNQNNFQREEQIYHEQNVYQHQNFKKNDIGVLKTNDFYQDAKDAYRNQYQNFKPSLPFNNGQKFPQPVIFNRTYQNIAFLNQQNNLDFCQQSANSLNNYNHSIVSEQKLAYDQKWLQCHQLFLAWYQKAKSLVQMQKQASKEGKRYQYGSLYYNFY